MEKDIPGRINPVLGTILGSVEDPRFPKVVDRTAPDPSQRNVEEMDMAGGGRRPSPFEGRGSIAFKG